MRVMNDDEVVEERLAVVLGVVTLRGRLVELAQLERDDLQALALDPIDDFADEAALDGVGLAEDEGALVSHERGRVTRSRLSFGIQPARVVAGDVGVVHVAAVHEHAVTETQRRLGRERTAAEEVVTRHR